MINNENVINTVTNLPYLDMNIKYMNKNKDNRWDFYDSGNYSFRNLLIQRVDPNIILLSVEKIHKDKIILSKDILDSIQEIYHVEYIDKNKEPKYLYILADVLRGNHKIIFKK